MANAKRTLPIVIFLFALASGIAWWFTSSQANTDKTEKPTVARQGSGGGGGQPIVVDAVKLKSQYVEENFVVNGTVLAWETVSIQPEITGKITGIFFEEGSPVSKGDLLVQLNDAELQASLQRAHYRLELAREREQRLRKLVEQNNVSQDDYDRALNELNVQRAEIEVIQAQIDKTQIYAPYSGVIGLRQASVGTSIRNIDPIATLNVIDRIKLEFSVPERHRSSLKIGQLVNFRVTGRNELFSAEVYAFESSIDVSTRSLTVRARATNDHGKLLPGAFATVDLKLGSFPEGLLVPTIAVIPSSNNSFVYLARNGKAEMQTITPGFRMNNELLVLSGVSEGDIVITSGLQRIRSGAQIEVRLAN